MFSIVTSVCDNTEWAKTYFYSLFLTLFDKNREIIIIDSSKEDFLLSANTYGLNVKIIREKHLFREALLQGTKYASNEKICFIDFDVIMLMHNWDKIMENFLHEEYELISSSSRFQIVAETNFLISDKETIKTSQLKGYDYINRVYGWDTTIMTFPSTPKNEPGVAITYLNYFYKNKIKLFPKMHIFPYELRLKHRWGDIALFDDDHELLYHNSWSARSKLLDMSEEAKQKFATPMSYVVDNAKHLFTYLEDKFPETPMSKYIESI